MVTEYGVSYQRFQGHLGIKFLVVEVQQGHIWPPPQLQHMWYLQEINLYEANESPSLQ